MNKYEAAYKKANQGGRHVSWYDTAIVLLANDLSEATGLKYNISGPFGLRAEVYISLGPEEKEKFIVVTPEFPDSGLKLYYDTGVMTKDYQPNTLGDYNGMNNVREPLPDTLEEIVKVLRDYR